MITKAGYTLAHELSGELGLILVKDASRLHYLAQRYARIQEQYCNENMSEAARECVEASEHQLEAAIKELAATMPNIKEVIFGGDPRGYTVKLLREDGKYNTWGGPEDGWGVA